VAYGPGVDDAPESRRLAVDGRLVGLVAAAAALAAFVVQNTDDVRIDWLVFDVNLPLWLALLITAVLGTLISNLAGWVLRRRG